MIESLVTHSKTLEAKISQFARIPLGPTKSGKQVEDSRESNKEFEEILNEKNVEIEKNSPTQPEKEVVKKVEKEVPYVVPPQYKPTIVFQQIFVDYKVRGKKSGELLMSRGEGWPLRWDMKNVELITKILIRPTGSEVWTPIGIRKRKVMDKRYGWIHEHDDTHGSLI